MIWSGVFAGLVITNPGKVGGVAGPVASGFAGPAHCCDRAEVEQVGEDRSG